MAAHKLRIYRKYFLFSFPSQSPIILINFITQGGNIRHALNAAVLTFTAVTSMSFMICAHEVNSKYEAMREAFKRNPHIKEDTSRQNR
jgi:hypothetical protein